MTDTDAIVTSVRMYDAGYNQALDDILKLNKHYYKTYESEFIEEQEVIFIEDILQLKNQKDK